ncbi:glycoside hydrolase [Marasmius fiardii PR-910]|nr:glycoside hydrolase [Marasmius fiardii PR-910]
MVSYGALLLALASASYSHALTLNLKAQIQAGGLKSVSAAWYAGWHAQDFPLSKLPWDKYTYLTYSFGIPTEDPSIISLEGSAPEVLPEFVKTAHKHKVGAFVSLGGWTGSRFFSTAVNSPENRTILVKAVTDFAKKYDLDGIDFDWEYPNKDGIGCNTKNPNDTSNFLEFLKQLRSTDIGKDLVLTAATSISPFADADGSPTKDVSAFAQVLDYIALMNYDIWGSWSATVGPNAPLDDSCAAPQNQQGSGVSAVKAWHAAGVPLNQLLLGVPSYGHSFTVNKTAAFTSSDMKTLALYPGFNASVHQKGDRWDDAAGPDVCGVEQSVGGNFNFWGIIENGYLKQDGTPKPSVPYRFDDCSKTAYVYDKNRELMISFDDANSFVAKGEYIAKTGLAGFAIWEAGGDYNHILLDAIRQGCHKF